MDFYLIRFSIYGHPFLSSNFYILGLDNSSLFFMPYDNDVVSNSLKWHARLGYIWKDRMTRIAEEGLLGSLTNVSLLVCES
jgi:hypothetical protein